MKNYAKALNTILYLFYFSFIRLSKVKWKGFIVDLLPPRELIEKN